MEGRREPEVVTPPPGRQLEINHQDSSYINPDERDRTPKESSLNEDPIIQYQEERRLDKELANEKDSIEKPDDDKDCQNEYLNMAEQYLDYRADNITLDSNAQLSELEQDDVNHIRALKTPTDNEIDLQMEEFVQENQKPEPNEKDQIQDMNIEEFPIESSHVILIPNMKRNSDAISELSGKNINTNNLIGIGTESNSYFTPIGGTDKYRSLENDSYYDRSCNKTLMGSELQPQHVVDKMLKPIWNESPKKKPMINLRGSQACYDDGMDALLGLPERKIEDVTLVESEMEDNDSKKGDDMILENQEDGYIYYDKEKRESFRDVMSSKLILKPECMINDNFSKVGSNRDNTNYHSMMIRSDANKGYAIEFPKTIKEEDAFNDLDGDED